jgi:hypothetical protein
MRVPSVGPAARQPAPMRMSGLPVAVKSFDANRGWDP